MRKVAKANFLVVAILGFVILAFFAKQYPYFSFDLNISLFIQKFNPIWFFWLMMLITFLGNGLTALVIVILMATYCYLFGKRKTPAVLIFSTIGGFILSYILKILIVRPRPDPLLVHQVGTFLKADSFPSGHVLGAVSLYGFLLYIAYTQLKSGFFRYLVVDTCILVIILMGLSRIYLGAHWFSDVLGAYLIGLVWLSFMVFLFQKLETKVKS